MSKRKDNATEEFSQQQAAEARLREINAEIRRAETTLSGLNTFIQIELAKNTLLELKTDIGIAEDRRREARDRYLEEDQNLSDVRVEIRRREEESEERLEEINSLIKTAKESQTADIEETRHTLYLINTAIRQDSQRRRFIAEELTEEKATLDQLKEEIAGLKHKSESG